MLLSTLTRASALALLCALAIPASTAHADAIRDLPPSTLEQELRCMALNIYHEARGEGYAGMFAVAQVVVNRMTDDRWPDTACAVIKQGGEIRRHRCQFSWYCDGRSDNPTDADAWRDAKTIARTVYNGLAPDITKGALWYHASHVSPSWSTRLARGPVIGDHIFYTDPRPQLARRQP